MYWTLHHIGQFITLDIKQCIGQCIPLSDAFMSKCFHGRANGKDTEGLNKSSIYEEGLEHSISAQSVHGYLEVNSILFSTAHSLVSVHRTAV